MFLSILNDPVLEYCLCQGWNVNSGILQISQKDYSLEPLEINDFSFLDIQSSAKEDDWFNCSFHFKFTENVAKGVKMWQIRRILFSVPCPLQKYNKFPLCQSSWYLLVQSQQKEYQKKVKSVRGKGDSRGYYNA